MKRRTDWLILLGFLVISPMSLMGGCGKSDDGGTGPGDAFTVPAAWQGVWETTSVTKDCEGNVLDTSTDLDDLCEGEVLSFDEEGQEVTCTGTGNDTSFNLTCNASGTVEGCSYTVTATFMGTRNGDTYTATAHIQVTVSGSGECFGSFCEDVEITGMRTGGTPNCTSTAPSFLHAYVTQAIEQAQLQ